MCPAVLRACNRCDRQQAAGGPYCADAWRAVLWGIDAAVLRRHQLAACHGQMAHPTGRVSHVTELSFCMRKRLSQMTPPCFVATGSLPATDRWRILPENCTLAVHAQVYQPRDTPLSIARLASFDAELRAACAGRPR